MPFEGQRSRHRDGPLNIFKLESTALFIFRLCLLDHVNRLIMRKTSRRPGFSEEDLLRSSGGLGASLDDTGYRRSWTLLTQNSEREEVIHEKGCNRILFNVSFILRVAYGRMFPPL